jgi:HK97 gp10 family phage protein
MSDVTFEVDGVSALLRALDDLEEKVSKRVIRRSLSRAARVIARAMKAAAPVGPTGNLKRSIGLRERRIRGGYLQRVGPRIGGKGQHKGQHAYFIERGAKERFRKRGGLGGLIGLKGKGTGKVEATHVFERAFDSVAAQANQRLAREIAIGIEEAARGG